MLKWATLNTNNELWLGGVLSIERAHSWDRAVHKVAPAENGVHSQRSERREERPCPVARSFNTLFTDLPPARAHSSSALFKSVGNVYLIAIEKYTANFNAGT